MNMMNIFLQKKKNYVRNICKDYKQKIRVLDIEPCYTSTNPSPDSKVVITYQAAHMPSHMLYLPKRTKISSHFFLAKSPNILHVETPYTHLVISGSQFLDSQPFHHSPKSSWQLDSVLRPLYNCSPNSNGILVP